MPWDSLRFLLAIARSDSLSAAARRLGVSQPTVSRRLAAMENGLGVRLFDRAEHGYALTTAGSEIYQTAEHMEEEVAGLERRVFGRDWRLRGSLRVTCTEVMANRYLARHFAGFLAEHPDIDLGVVCTFQHLSLSRREADIAIRVTANPPDTLVGRRLATVALGVYAAPGSEVLAGGGAALAGAEWIGWEDETYNRMLIDRHFPGAIVRHRVDDMLTMCSMARAGIGVVLVPCYVADPDPLLTRVVAAPITADVPDLWVLSHPDIRRAARVRVFTDFMAGAILADRDLFEGRRPAT